MEYLANANVEVKLRFCSEEVFKNSLIYIIKIATEEVERENLNQKLIKRIIKLFQLLT